jgi:integrase/recombinase XerD
LYSGTHYPEEPVLSVPDVNTPLGIRDRAIMEFLYSTGLRRTEAVRMRVEDVDMENGLVYVRQGKGGKARVVPIGERAIQWLKKYLLDVRTQLAKGGEVNTLFLTQHGTPISAWSLDVWVTNYLKQCGQRGSCHRFRHAMATAMMDQGADLRHIQEILGHESISTTQVYTHTSIEKIKQVYHATHPASKHPDPEIQEVTAIATRQRCERSQKQLAQKRRPDNELVKWAQEYLTSLRLANYSEWSVSNYQDGMRLFVLWCQEQGIVSLDGLNQAVIEKYHQHLAYKQVRGHLLGMAYIGGRIGQVCRFCRFLADRRALPYNIAQKVQLPKIKRCIPCQVLSPQEIARILGQPDVRTGAGVRDRAVLEVLYATGIRRQELMSVEIGDINVEAGTVFIRKGKGGRQRVVPIASSALVWVQKYLEAVRPVLSQDEKQKALFLNDFGNPMSKNTLDRILKQYARSAGITKPVSCHKFRHAMATALLDNGADIRTVQEILGHSSLTSTQIYTKVAIRKLKEVHAQTHPARSKPQGHRHENT